MGKRAIVCGQAEIEESTCNAEWPPIATRQPHRTGPLVRGGEGGYPCRVSI